MLILFYTCISDNTLDIFVKILLNFSSSCFILLMNSPGDGWNKLSSVGFSKGIERIGLEIEMNFILESASSPLHFNLLPHLVFGEQFEPLLEELIQVICHIIIGGGKLVAEGET